MVQPSSDPDIMPSKRPPNFHHFDQRARSDVTLQTILKMTYPQRLAGQIVAHYDSYHSTLRFNATRDSEYVKFIYEY